MGNVVFRGLNAQYVSDAFFLKKLDVLGSFEIRTNRNILSNVRNSELIKRVFIENFNTSIGVTCSNSVWTVVCLLVNKDSSGVPFGLDLLSLSHKKILETFASFIHVKCKRINSFILGKAFELLSQFLVLRERF
jgi:hypothetical protein